MLFLGNAATIVVTTTVVAAAAVVTAVKATETAAAPSKPLTISGPFADNMVLQSNHLYGQRSFMSGTAEPYSSITVNAPMREEKGSLLSVTADEQGYWKVTLEPVQATMKPYNITISGKTRGGVVYTPKIAHNVRFGEVIICGGQSNMDRVVGYDLDNGTAEVAASGTYKNIFLWTQRGVRPLRQAKVASLGLGYGGPEFQSGSWLRAAPTTVKNYSAVCYETARQLVDRHLGYDTPVGLVWTAVGGTPIQYWMPPSSFGADGCEQSPGEGDSSLFEAIIKPLTNYSHRGVLWYQVCPSIPLESVFLNGLHHFCARHQGEANVDGHSRWLGERYGACFQAMIAGISRSYTYFMSCTCYRLLGDITYMQYNIIILCIG
jgi:hypothetical protein